ncbi:MAG: adenosylcobinamide-GDP ribazoletransferase [Chloroflexi bacterium]|nr:adenosylcobinamide-GDP ribazoletransferase [Chloroflexota bacterium]
MSPLPALAFLTRLPVPGRKDIALDDVARSQLWFPGVGLLVGAILVAIDRLAARALPDPSADVIIVVALAAVTGALHLDGLADAADGMLGGHTPARRLEIMRDVHAGTYAIVAVVSVLALKWAGLAALPSNVRVETLLLVPCLARFAMLVAIPAFPYGRREGVGAGFRSHAWPAATVIGGATAITASVVLLGPGGLYPAAAAIAVALLFGMTATRLAGGMTGDLYGATVEMAEAALFVFIAAFANRGWVDAWVLQ